MKKILIGFIMDGKAGGVDKYILNFFNTVKKEDVQIDFLTNKIHEPLKEELSKHGSNLYEVPSLMRPLDQYKAVYEIASKNKYDKAYFNVSTAITFPAVKAARKAGVKHVVVHSHSSGYDCESDKKRKLMTLLHNVSKPMLSKYATHFLTCSDKAAHWLFTKEVVQSGKVKNIQNAVDVSKFSFSQKRRDEIRKELNVEDKFVIGNVGNMLYQKNQFFLIDVFKEVTKLDDDAVLVIIGDGPRRQAIEEKIESYGISDKVILLGRIDASDGYMSAFDVFALPSYFEGMPIVSVEAQCSMLPCVFSDTITSQAKISNMCEFVDINDKNAWAKALLAFKNADRTKMKILKNIDEFDVSNQKALFKSIID